MTVAFSHKPMAMTNEKMQKTYLVVRCIADFLLLNRHQPASMPSTGGLFRGDSGPADRGHNVVLQTIHQGCGGKGNLAGTREAVLEKVLPRQNRGWMGFETFLPKRKSSGLPRQTSSIRW
jgi:hypothetical protein